MLCGWSKNGSAGTQPTGERGDYRLPQVHFADCPSPWNITASSSGTFVADRRAFAVYGRRTKSLETMYCSLVRDGLAIYAKLHYSTVVETTRRNRNNNASKWIRGVWECKKRFRRFLLHKSTDAPKTEFNDRPHLVTLFETDAQRNVAKL